MKSSLSVFTAFADSLFPSEVAYVQTHNEFEDPDYADILERMAKRLHYADSAPDFDPSIDPRKYSRLKQSFARKLESIDVDAYYAWISRINYLINTDAIPPEEQSRILREVDAFSPGWFHAGSFYRAMGAYESYLLIRYREKDHAAIRSFLERYRQSQEENEVISGEIHKITSKLVLGDGGVPGMVDDKSLQRLLMFFGEERLSKKTRYQAWLAYHMHHINARRMETLLAPLAKLEESIFKGGFYSRRILANFYANKLLLLSHMGKYEEAAWCGLQSIKHRTEDFLYYLNNYSSVLMHLHKYQEASVQMKEAFGLYKSTHDKGRRIVFAANYCRSLNALEQFKQSVRMARTLLEELDAQVFKFRWHYFFRVFLRAMLRTGQHALILRLDRKYSLREREAQGKFAPYIKAMCLAAAYHEVKVSDEAYIREKAELLNHAIESKQSELVALLQQL